MKRSLFAYFFDTEKMKAAFGPRTDTFVLIEGKYIVVIVSSDLISAFIFISLSGILFRHSLFRKMSNHV